MPDPLEPSSFGESFWSLYHSSSHTLVDGLTWRQMRAIVNTIAPQGVPDWKVWMEGQPEWAELSSKIDSILAAKAGELHIPPLAPAIKGRDADTSGQKMATPVDMRMVKRFRRRVEVVVETGEKKITAYSRDISSTNIKLETDLPFSIVGSFKVTLKAEPNPIELLCQLQRQSDWVSLSNLKIIQNPNMPKYYKFLASN